MDRLQLSLLCVSVLLVMFLCKPTHSSKILMAATSGGSHMISSLEIAKTMAARGHKVWMTIDDDNYHTFIRGRDISPDITFLRFPIALSLEEQFRMRARYVATQLRDADANSDQQFQKEEADDGQRIRTADGRDWNIFNAVSFVIDDILSNTEFMESLNSVEFDVIIGDTVMMYHVFFGQVLHAPVVQIGLTSICPSQHDRFAGSPSNPAYVPERMSFLSDTLSFRERLKNTFLYWMMAYVVDKYMYGPMNAVLKRHNIRPDANFGELLAESDMWIFNSDFVVDYPRPLSPHVKFVGGFLTGPAQPLSEEWQEFMESSAEHGVVILTLGTLITSQLTDEQVDNIAKSLAMLPQKVAWSYSGEPPKTLGKNTKISSWLPQNDMLGHPKMRAMISHGGQSSVHQCIYHAVPIVGIPVFGDQKDNVIRLVGKGMAVLLDIRALNERTIYDATVEVIYNKTYRESVQRWSAIARDRPTPMTPLEEVAYWVEYTVKHGTSHLRPRSLQLSWVQYYLLDVIAAMVLAVVGMGWGLRRMWSMVRKSFAQDDTISKTN